MATATKAKPKAAKTQPVVSDPAPDVAPETTQEPAAETVSDPATGYEVAAEPVAPAPAETKPAEETPEVKLQKAMKRLERWEGVTELEREVAYADHEVTDAKEQLKAAKEHHDSLVIRLRAAIRSANDGQQSLPFPEESTSTTTPPVADEAWKAVALEELGITGKLAESLTDAGLSTLGAIADYTAAGKLLTDIAGIGNGKAEKIQAACEDYWTRHPRTEPASDGGENGDGEAGANPVAEAPAEAPPQDPQ